MDELTRLDDAQVSARLETLYEWSIDDGKLYREFIFPRFVDAFGFMASVAVMVERHGHHPEWSNVNPSGHVSADEVRTTLVHKVKTGDTACLD